MILWLVYKCNHHSYSKLCPASSFPCHQNDLSRMNFLEFENSNPKFIHISLNNCFPCSYIWASFEFVPVIKLSTYKSIISCLAIGPFFEWRWETIVAISMNRLQIIPKGILVNLNMSLLLGMTGLLMYFSHRNLVTSRSCSWRLIWGKAFSVCATMTVSCIWNLRSSEHKSSKISGPRYKDSFKLRIVFLAFADASYTILSFVVRLFRL